MNFDDLLARADDEILQKLVGTPALRLLKVLDPRMLVPTRLRSVLLGLQSRAELLLNPESQTLLLELLRESEAQSLASVIAPGAGKNVFKALQDVALQQSGKRKELLLAFFNLDLPRLEVPEEKPSLQARTAAYGLFSHQRRAAHAVQKKLEKPPHRVMLHMPTGSGKTRTAMNVIADHLRRREYGLVIWLAYSEELCEQAASEFERAWYHLGNRSVHVHRFWGKHELNLVDVRDGIIIAGLGKLYNAAKQSIDFIGKLSSRSSLIIIDEAHQSIADTYRLVLESLLALHPGTGLLGLTATPGRTYTDVEEDKRLARFFEKQKVVLQIEGYKNPVTYLMDHGYLAHVTFKPIYSKNSLTLSPADIKKIKEGLDIPENVLRRLAEDEQRNLLIIYKLEELASRHQRILVFAATVEHAHLLATVMQARGWNAGAVTGKTSSHERKRLIEQFKGSLEEPIFLCNFGVLTTGFDAPSTSAALIARPTKSLVLYSQMVGRATRGIKAGGHAEAEIVTVLDTSLPGFGDMAEAFMNWEDVWA